jgi:outer membrane receptor protein involved in Fe transport
MPSGAPPSRQPQRCVSWWPCRVTFSEYCIQALFQPKGSLIFTPVDTTEFYVSAGRGFHSDDLRGVNQAMTQGVPGAALIASETGEEIGVRQQLLGQKVALTLAVFNLDARSQTTYNPDVGQDTAGPASRRTGYEINITYQALRWLEFYVSFSQTTPDLRRPLTMAQDIWANTCRMLRLRPDRSMST